MQYSVVLALVFLVVPFQNGLALDCPTTSLSPELRQRIEDEHNKLRSSLARGLEKVDNQANAPSGKNIYKLSYDCDLEASAQRWADKCTFDHSSYRTRNASENLYWNWGRNTSPKRAVAKAINSWWSELFKFGIDDAQNRLTNEVFASGVGHFTAMAWGYTTKVGCAVGNGCMYKKRKAAYVVCHYRKVGNILGSVIYELGSPCMKDADCTTYGSSKCSVDEGLCLTAEQQAEHHDSVNVPTEVTKEQDSATMPTETLPPCKPISEV